VPGWLRRRRGRADRLGCPPERRGGEPVLQIGLLHHRSFAGGQLLALLYFAGFTSLFFTLSILWQDGLGRSAAPPGCSSSRSPWAA
jgi:hypothetical protein